MSYNKFERLNGLDIGSVWDSNLTHGFLKGVSPLYENLEPNRGLGSTWNINLKQRFTSLFPHHADSQPYTVRFNNISSFSATVANSLPNVSHLLPKSYSEISSNINVRVPRIETNLSRIINDFHFKDLIDKNSIETFLKHYKDGQDLLESSYSSKEYLHKKIKEIFQSVAIADNINELRRKALLKVKSLVNVPAIIKYLIEYHIGKIIDKVYELIRGALMVAILSVPPDAPPDASEQIKVCYEELLGAEVVEQVEQQAFFYTCRISSEKRRQFKG